MLIRCKISFLVNIFALNSWIKLYMKLALDDLVVLLKLVTMATSDDTSNIPTVLIVLVPLRSHSEALDT